MSRGNVDQLRWGVEQRLNFIEERLYWLGTINRQDLIDRFNVSMGQASADINRYLGLKPADVVYDKSAKCYVAGEDFSPVLAAANPDRILGEMRLISAGVLCESATLLGLVPPFDAAPTPERPVAPDVLRAIWSAIRAESTLDISYQSMSRPKPAPRPIDPHALAHDGFRWHARAWDHETGEFRDFVLGRMSRPKQGGPRRHGPDADDDWNNSVDLRIAPHPDLTTAQAAAIRLDYGIERDHSVISVRRALLFYALRRLGLDIPLESRRPQEQHIVLLNRDEVMASIGGREPE